MSPGAWHLFAIVARVQIRACFDLGSSYIAVINRRPGKEKTRETNEGKESRELRFAKTTPFERSFRRLVPVNTFPLNLHIDETACQGRFDSEGSTTFTNNRSVFGAYNFTAKPRLAPFIVLFARFFLLLETSIRPIART